MITNNFDRIMLVLRVEFVISTVLALAFGSRIAFVWAMEYVMPLVPETSSVLAMGFVLEISGQVALDQTDHCSRDRYLKSGQVVHSFRSFQYRHHFGWEIRLFPHD
jgi:hypothetical protein